MTFQSPETSEYQKETREVKRLKNGSISFPYSKENSLGDTMNYDFTLSKNPEGQYIIKNETKNATSRGYMKKENLNKTYILDTWSSQAFKTSLGKALDAFIDPSRPSAGEKADKAYELLGFSNVLKSEEQERVVQQTKKENTELLQMVNQFDRDEKTQTLSYSYTIKNEGKDRTVNVSFKKQGENILLIMDAFNTWSITGGKNDVVESCPLSKINSLPSIISIHFQKGIPFGTATGKETVSVEGGDLLTKITEKAKNAVKVFNYHSKK